MNTISITYNNSVIATLTAGQGITLSCGSKKMASDITIESNGATATVTYKDKIIATLTEGGKIILPCKDKIAQQDIIVRNTSIPEEGEDGEEIPEEYVVSGAWVFNETIDPLYTMGGFNLDFYCNGKKCTGIGCYDAPIGYDTYYWLDDDTWDVYNSYKNVWADESYRTITIKEPQVLSKEDYEWLTANATNTTQPIEGAWIFYGVISVDQNLYEPVKFTCDGIEYSYMTGCLDGNIGYLSYDGTGVYHISSNTWSDYIYRTIEFVDTQYVSKEFYEWLTANASKVGHGGGSP